MRRFPLISHSTASKCRDRDCPPPRAPRLGLLVLALLPLAALHCGTKSDTLSGNTNWLKPCSIDSECGTLACECGHCIDRCSDQVDCTQPPESVCVTGATTGTTGTTGSASTSGGAGGGGSTGTQSSTGSTGSVTGGGLTGAPPDGQCSASDCAMSCTAVVPGGYGVCPFIPAPATSCSRMADTCCSSSDCTAGTCYPTNVYPTGPCGGGTGDTINQCRTDACTTDADCGADSVCAPAGVVDSVRACIKAYCRTDGDCTAESGGKCVLTKGGCCGGVGNGFDVRAPTLACAYPSGWCLTDQDCAAGGFCIVDGGRLTCSSQCR